MVLGYDKGFRLVDSLPGTEGYFIYSDRRGGFLVSMTPGFVAEQ